MIEPSRMLQGNVERSCLLTVKKLALSAESRYVSGSTLPGRDLCTAEGHEPHHARCLLKALTWCATPTRPYRGLCAGFARCRPLDQANESSRGSTIVRCHFRQHSKLPSRNPKRVVAFLCTSFLYCQACQQPWDCTSDILTVVRGVSTSADVRSGV